MKMAGKIMGMSTPPINLQAIFNQSALRQAQNIISDPSHVLNAEFELLPSLRRYRTVGGNNRFKNSFVPLSIKLVNDAMY